MSHDMALWEFIRSSGLLAYLLLSASVGLGVAVRVRALDWLVKRAWTFEVHQAVSVLALAFTGVHVGLLLVNNHVPFDIVEILVPLASDWKPLPVAAGILGLYAVASIVISSFIRARIGQRAWRAIHFSSFGAWALALFHGVFSGSDSSLPWVQYMYLATAGTVAFLTLFRVLEATVVAAPASRETRSAPPSRRAHRPLAGPSGGNLPCHPAADITDLGRAELPVPIRGWTGSLSAEARRSSAIIRLRGAARSSPPIDQSRHGNSTQVVRRHLRPDDGAAGEAILRRGAR